MTFEEVILKESKMKIAALYPQAVIAAKNPETGVKILNKSAYFVIRDCAQTTVQYLPVLCYGSFKNLPNDLNQKFTKKQIVDFVKKTETNAVSKQLLKIILDDADITIEDDTIIDFGSEDDNPYGNYSYTATEENKQTGDIAGMLISYFQAT